MGTVESSTLDSVEALSVTLTDIERKLTSIEDVHLHHDRTICHDDVIIISGKRIACRSAVSLIVGPVLGTISQTTVRVMIETDISTTIEFHLFHVDELIPTGRYHSSKIVQISGFNATAWTLSGLLPDIKYSLYIGGVSPKEALLKYATFNTLPVHAEDLRLVIIGAGGVEDAVSVSGEKNLLHTVDQLIRASSRPPSPKPVHITLHMGDFLSVDGVMKLYGLQLLDLLCRDDSNENVWRQMFLDAEEAMLHVYRRAMNHASVSDSFRSSGHIFVTGAGEAGLAVAALLGVEDAGPGITGKLEHEMEVQKEMEEMAKKKRAEDRMMKKYGIKTAPAKAKSTEPVEDKDPDGVEDTEEEDEENEEEQGQGRDLMTGVEDALYKELRLLNRGLFNRMEVQDSLRRMVLAALLRLARRVNRRYMRQLWDEDFGKVDETDRRDEQTHREELKLKRMLWAKKEVQRRLRHTVQKLEDQFGKDHAACLQVRESLRGASLEVEDAQGSLDAMATSPNERSSSLSSSSPSSSHGDTPVTAVLDLGGVLFLVLETNWGWLTSEGTVHEATRTNLNVHPQTWESLEQALSLKRDGSEISRGITIVDQEMEFSKEKLNDVKTFLILSPSPLIPTGAPADLVPSPSFSLLGEDLRDLLTSASRWQSGDLKRAVLVVEGGTGFSGSGWVLPPSTEVLSSEVTSVWVDRSKLRLLAVGSLMGTPGPPTVALPRTKVLPPTVRHFPVPLPGEPVLSFSCVLDVEPRGGIGMRSFWEAHPVSPSGVPGDGSTFEFVLHSDTGCDDEDNAGTGTTAATLVLGPVVCALTSTTVTLLLEASRGGFVTIYVIDQLTGVEHVLQRRLHARNPTAVTIDGLLPHRPYTAYAVCDGGADKTDTLVVLQDSLLATFTTQIDVRSSTTTLGERQAVSDARANAFLENSDVEKVNPDLNPDSNHIPATATAMGAASTTITEDVSIRLVLLGGTKVVGTGTGTGTAETGGPSALSTSGPSPQSLLEQRQGLTDGFDLMRQVALVHRCPYSPLHLTLHLGGVVDLEEGCKTALAALAVDADSEKLEGDASQALHLSRAQDAVRGAYHTSWGARSAMRELLQSGSNLFLSSPTIDVCSALGDASSILHLERDYSPESISQLLQLATTADSSYQGQAWGHGHDDGPCLRTHFLHGGAVAVLGLRPTVPSLQYADGPGDALLTAEHFSALGDFLSGSGSLSSSLLHIRLLVVASPIPFLSGETSASQTHSYLSSGHRHIHYTSDDLIRLFGILGHWLSSDGTDGRREVLLACGGAPVSFITEIEGFELKNGTRSSASTAPRLKLKQVCVGYTTTTTPSDSPLLALQPGELVAPRTDTSSEILYKYKHFMKTEVFPTGVVIEWSGSMTKTTPAASGDKDTGRTNAVISIVTASSLRDNAVGGVWKVDAPSSVSSAFRKLDDVLAGRDNVDQEAATVLAAVRYSLETAEAREVLVRTFDLMREGRFGMVSQTIFEAEKVLSVLLLWVRRQLEKYGKLLLRLGDPSPLLVRHLWEAYCGRVVQQVPAPLMTSRSELAWRALGSDEQVFIQFVGELLEASTVFQSCSHLLGLSDGW
eukprot:gene4510-8965_t